jgi:hypothetical protein
MIDTWAFNTELLLSEKMNKQSLLHCHFERIEKSAEGAGHTLALFHFLP